MFSSDSWNAFQNTSSWIYFHHSFIWYWIFESDDTGQLEVINNFIYGIDTRHDNHQSGKSTIFCSVEVWNKVMQIVLRNQLQLDDSSFCNLCYAMEHVIQTQNGSMLLVGVVARGPFQMELRCTNLIYQWYVSRGELQMRECIGS